MNFRKIEEEVKRNENGVPEDREQLKAEMFLEEFLYRATDRSTGELDMDRAINTLLIMKDLNSFQFFGERE